MRVSVRVRVAIVCGSVFGGMAKADLRFRLEICGVTGGVDFLVMVDRARGISA